MDVIFERLPACELLDSTWSSLPDDLLFRILSERISFDAHGGVELSLLSRHIFDAIGRQALCGSIRIRDRLGLAQYLVAIRDDPQRADSLRNLYVCNRLDHSIESSSLRQLDPAPRYTSWDSSALEEAASETTLALATLYRTDVPAVGQGHQEAGTGGSNTHGLDWLRIRHPRGSANAAATTSNKDDGNQFEINEWTSAGLAYIFAKCSNLEFVHVWEPFTLGYPCVCAAAAAKRTILMLHLMHRSILLAGQSCRIWNTSRRILSSSCTAHSHRRRRIGKGSDSASRKCGS